MSVDVEPEMESVWFVLGASNPRETRRARDPRQELTMPGTGRSIAKSNPREVEGRLAGQERPRERVKRSLAFASRVYTCRYARICEAFAGCGVELVLGGFEAIASLSAR